MANKKPLPTFPDKIHITPEEHLEEINRHLRRIGDLTHETNKILEKIYKLKKKQMGEINHIPVKNKEVR